MFDGTASILLSGEANLSFAIWALVFSAFLIVLNGFYVAYEFAIVAAKRSTYEAEEIADKATSKAAIKSLSDLSMQLAGAQLGITIASLALGRIGEPAFEAIIELFLGSSVSPEQARLIGFVSSLTIFTFLHLVLGEMVPKNIALAAPDATLRWLVLPYRAYLFVFRPFALFLNSIANVGCRALGVEPRDEILTTHTASELANIIAESAESGKIEADDGELLRGVLEFSEREVSEIAVPVEQMNSARLGVTVKQLEKIVSAKSQDRIPILSSKKNNDPIGYIHARDLLSIKPEEYSKPFPASLVRQMAVVRGDRPLIEVLRLMRRLKRQLAVVNDPNGPLGIVSLEDVTRALLTTNTSSSELSDQ